MNLVRKRLRAHLKIRGINKAQLARDLGVSQGFVGQVAAGKKRPGPRILSLLGLEAFESYRPRREGSGGSMRYSAAAPVEPRQ